MALGKDAGWGKGCKGKTSATEAVGSRSLVAVSPSNALSAAQTVYGGMVVGG